ncbi:fibronectin/fibrinogen-binding protein [hydrocarbon metagenome]|uniref:Fibronectin/fibrinogen-binding protein n=1 Tax=hydrocarbon metagenome TaxID=938273 RepID=A0A0W8E637_9ZZZZ
MPFDGIAIKAVTEELNSSLLDARIDKIHQPEKDELLLTTRHPKFGTHRLLISANARWSRMHMTEARKTNPKVPPSFCMLLRKYLEGGKIKSIRQVDFERIVHIDIEALDEFREWKSKILVCEFMGRHSNIILINPENRIILDGIKRYGSDLSSFREVLPGKEYIDPPSQDKLNPLDIDYEALVQKIWEQDSNIILSSALFQSCTGISPFLAKEICMSVGLDPNIPVEECGEYELTAIFRRLKALLIDVGKGQTQPTVIYNENRPVEFCPYNPASGTYKTFDSFNIACDTFYTSKLDYLRLESMKTNLSRNIKTILDKAYKKLFFQTGDLSNAEENEKYRIWGELITAYSYQFSKGDTLAVLNDFYTEEQVSIELDPRYTPMQNAQKYFKIYNKSRKAIKHLEGLMNRNREEIDYLESILVAIQQAESPDEIDEIIEELENENYVKGQIKRRSRPNRSIPRRFISSDGMEILVGRNNRQNDILSIKMAERTDLWLHTKNIPGTHVIIKLPRQIKSIQDMPDATLEESALLAAHFSKAEQSEKVEVDYTFRSNVKKPGGARPGMVIYENYWTILVNPQEERIKKLLEAEIKET